MFNWRIDSGEMESYFPKRNLQRIYIILDGEILENYIY